MQNVKKNLCGTSMYLTSEGKSKLMGDEQKGQMLFKQPQNKGTHHEPSYKKYW